MIAIALFGAPGAGKGTQSKMLIERYNLMYVSTGDILRQEIAEGSELGKEAESIIARGGLVSDEIIIQIIEHRISNDDQHDGILFDGFPRTVVQAYILEGLLHRMNTHLLCMLSLEVPREELIDRMLKRAEVSGRADDKKDVILNRFKEYDEKTIPVAKFYQEKGVYHSLNGTGKIQDVFQRLTNVIDQVITESYKNIIIYGSPGAGKGTQAKRLAEKYGLIYVSTGAMIRDEINNHTETGEICKNYVLNGDNVPDEIAIRLIKDKIKANADAKGFVFKGFPSTYVQAYIMDGILDRHHSSVSCMIEITSSSLQCVKRLVARGKTDHCRLYDKEPETIIHRIEVYERAAGKVRAYYQKRNKYFLLDGDRPADNVFTDLCSIVETNVRGVL